jgi:hypothetical protein
MEHQIIARRTSQKEIIKRTIRKEKITIGKKNKI